MFCLIVQNFNLIIFNYVQVLGDDDKRAKYDNGEDIDEGMGGGGGGGFNPFGAGGFGGGGGGGGYTFHFEGGFPGGGFGGFHM